MSFWRRFFKRGRKIQTHLYHKNGLTVLMALFFITACRSSQNQTGANQFGVAMKLAGGNSQVSHKGRLLPHPLSVRIVAPGSDIGVPHIAVNFRARAASGAIIHTGSATSNDDGLVTTQVTAPPLYDVEYQIEAVIEGSDDTVRFYLSTEVPPEPVEFVPGALPPASYPASDVVNMSAFRARMVDEEGTIIDVDGSQRQKFEISIRSGGSFLGTAENMIVGSEAQFTDIRSIRAGNYFVRLTHTRSGQYVERPITILAQAAVQSVVLAPWRPWNEYLYHDV